MQVIDGGKLGIEWHFKRSINCKEHALLYRSEYKGRGVQMEVISTKRNTRVFYFIDDDSRKFTDYEDFKNALKELAN